ncbi:MAG TPA: zinc-binding dehydrogenase [Anaerolineales bacterium]|nr:zinc-binding dehydrogenase [Anaerolineales bacterium]
MVKLTNCCTALLADYPYMETMNLVLRLHGAGELRLHEEPPPIPDPHEALIRVRAVGICGSDLHWFSEGGIGDALISKPLVLGHELAGQILTGERQDEQVAIDPAIPCGQCRSCRQGYPNLCPSVKFAGHGEQDGGLRGQMAWPEEHLFTLPDSVTPAEGALLEPLGVALHAVDLAKAHIGLSAGVFGCGPIGLLAIQLLRVMGASQIIATEILPHRLEAAREFGATHVIRAQNGLESAQILALTHNEGLDVCIEAAGENAAVESAIESARPGARVVLAGIPADDRTSFRASTARRKGLTIKLCRRMKHTYPRAIQLVESGKIDVASLITHRYPLTDYRKAIDTAVQREGLKVVIEP